MALSSGSASNAGNSTRIPTRPVHCSIETGFYDVMFGTDDSNNDVLNSLEQAVVDEIALLIDQQDDLSQLIPPPPQHLAKINKALTAPEPNLHRIMHLIENDPVLAGEVINLANSPYFRQTAQPIDCLAEAIELVGVSGIANIATMILSRDSVEIKPIYFRRFGRLIWQHSLETAVACKSLAAGEDPNRCYLLGLVHDAGKIIIFKCLSDCLSRCQVDTHPGGQMFKQMMIDYSLWLSCKVAEQWHLPQALITALKDQQLRKPHKSKLGDILYKANLCSELHLMIKAEKVSFNDAKILLQQQGLDSELIFCVYGGSAKLH